MKAKCINCGMEYGKNKKTKDNSAGYCPRCLDLLLNKRKLKKRLKREKDNVWVKMEIDRIDNILRWRRRGAR